MRLSLTIIAAALFLAGPAFAADTGQQSDQAKPDPNEIICRAGEPTTGSLLPGPRVCHTRKEWDDMQRQTQDGVSQMQVKSMDSNLHNTPGS
ncbi:MAG TPA: hypothetical protein VLW75_09070 [Rhizomicrobium sp.]|nr:hypothetical protein [Rhizomicrobium sp.]